MDKIITDNLKNNDDVLRLLRPYDGVLWMYFISKPRCEKRIFEILKSQNIPCYLPLISKTTVYSHRIYTRELPMFPNYIFAAACSHGFDIGKLNSSLLKVNFLSEQSSKELLNDLRLVRKYELLAKHHKVEVLPEIAEGTPVLIRKGYFKGDFAIVEKRKNRKIIIVNLSSVQMTLHVELPIDWVEAC